MDPIVLHDLDEIDASMLDAVPLDLVGARVAGVTRDLWDLGEGDRIEGSRVERLRLQRWDLPGVSLIECAVSDLDVTVLSGPASVWRDVEVAVGRWGSAELYDVQWRSVHLSGMRISYLNLRGADLMDVRLTDCVIDELDLAGARARRMAFPGCRVDRLALDRATLTDVDLRGLEPSAIDGIDGLRGATITHDQLLRWSPVLAGHLGLLVEG